MLHVYRYFIRPYFRFRFTAAYTIKFCSLLFVVVVHAGCDKQDSLIAAVCAVNCTVDRRSCCSHFSSHRYDSQIFVENRFLPTSPAFDAPVGKSPSEYCHDVWRGKARMVWLPDGEKNLKIDQFIRFNRIHERDRQTDRHRMTA